MNSEDDGDDWEAKEDDRRCWIARATSATVKALSDQARQVFDDALARGVLQGGLDPAFDGAADIARRLFELKLRGQTLPEAGDFSGPEGKMRIEARLSAHALSRILASTGASSRFEEALRRTVYELNRRRRKGDEQSDIDHKYGKAIRKVVARFREAIGAYVTQRNLGRLAVTTRDGRLVSVGDEGLILLVGEDGKLVEGGDGVMTSVATIAERKAAALRDLFEDLVDEAKPPGVPLIGRLFGGLGTTEHQILTYTMMRLTHPREMELLVDMRFKDAPFIPVPDLSFYGRGRDAKLIDAGLFDLQTLLGD